MEAFAVLPGQRCRNELEQWIRITADNLATWEKRPYMKFAPPDYLRTLAEPMYDRQLEAEIIEQFEIIPSLYMENHFKRYVESFDPEQDIQGHFMRHLRRNIELYDLLQQQYLKLKNFYVLDKQTVWLTQLNDKIREISTLTWKNPLKPESLRLELKLTLLSIPRMLSWKEIYSRYNQNCKSLKNTDRRKQQKKPVTTISVKTLNLDATPKPKPIKSLTMEEIMADDEPKPKRQKPKPKKRSEIDSRYDFSQDEDLSKFHNISPWKTLRKVKSYGKRHGWDDVKIESEAYDTERDSFNWKRQRKFMKHWIAPPHTFVIDYFFPGKFAYLLAINVNTRKLFYSLPSFFKRMPNGGWTKNENQQFHASTKSSIRSMLELMQQTTIKGLLMDQESAWKSKFHQWLTENGITWKHEDKTDMEGVIDTKDKRRSVHSVTSLIDRVIKTLRVMNRKLGNPDEIPPNVLEYLVDEYNQSPHTTLSRLLKRPTSPNDVDDNPALEKQVMTALMKENFLVETDPAYQVKGKVQVYNSANHFDKVRPKLLPGYWEVVGRKDGLFEVKRGNRTILANRWMLKSKKL